MLTNMLKPPFCIHAMQSGGTALQEMEVLQINYTACAMHDLHPNSFSCMQGQEQASSHTGDQSARALGCYIFLCSSDHA